MSLTKDQIRRRLSAVAYIGKAHDPMIAEIEKMLAEYAPDPFDDMIEAEEDSEIESYSQMLISRTHEANLDMVRAAIENCDGDASSLRALSDLLEEMLAVKYEASAFNAAVEDSIAAAAQSRSQVMAGVLELAIQRSEDPASAQALKAALAEIQQLFAGEGQEFDLVVAMPSEELHKLAAEWEQRGYSRCLADGAMPSRGAGANVADVVAELAEKQSAPSVKGALRKLAESLRA